MDSTGGARQVAFDAFVLDRTDERLLGESGPVRIGHKAYCVLDALVSADGRLVTKDELFDCVWDGVAVSDSALTSVVKELRRALGDDTREPRFIESVYGRGYRFLAPIAAAPHAEVAPQQRAAEPRRLPQRPGFSRRQVALGLGGTTAVAIGIVAATQRRAIADMFASADTTHRLAVLPFANLSGDPEQSYFADGVSEELRSRLTRLPALQVAARTSSNSFRGSDDVGTIGQRLGVEHLIEGTVRRQADMVRIAARLVTAQTGFERWSQTYDRPFTDIFALQSDIAHSVTRALQIELLGGQTATLDRAGTASPEAFDAYVRGRALFDLSGDEATYRGALAAFERAIALDPRYAAAHAARARTLAAIANQYAAADQLKATYAEGLAAARRAVALAPELDEAQSALGYLLVNGSLDFAAAREPYERSFRSGRNNADVLIRYGLFATRAGRMDAGLSALRRSTALDPLNPRAFKAYGQGLFATRRYAASIPPLRQALALNPQISSVHAAIGDALLMLGQTAEARTSYAREPQEFSRLTGLAIADWKLGRPAEAERSRSALVQESGDSGAYQQAQIAAQWGKHDIALMALERAFAVGDSGLIYLRNDPFLDGLREDARFKSLLARVRI